MNSFERPFGLRLDRARDCFGEIQDAEALLRPMERKGRRRIAASQLYGAARSGADAGPEIQGVLRDSRGARGFYRQAVAETACFALPEARAASSRQAAARHGEGCTIRVERSRAEPDQFFVVVELARDAVAAAIPTSLIVCDSDDHCRRFPLPAVRDGIAQIIADADSDLMRLIADPTTKVYLR